MSSLPVLLWLPNLAPSYMRSPNSRGPKAAVMKSILMLWSKTSEHYLTIHKTQCTAWQYTATRGSLSSIRVITRRIYQMNHCTQWSSVFTMVLRLNLRVSMVHAYLRCINAQEGPAGAEGIDGTMGVTGVTTLLHNILVHTHMCFGAYGRRSYSSLRILFTSTRMFWSLLLHSACLFLPASSSLLTFRAFFSCAFDWG